MTSSRGSSTRQVHCQSDNEVRAEIVRLVDNMTSTGQRSLDDKSLRALKQLCRYVCSMSNIRHFADLTLVSYCLLLFGTRRAHTSSLTKHDGPDGTVKMTVLRRIAAFYSRDQINCCLLSD